MTAQASDIQITASLIDDYLLTMDAPVGQNPAGRFIAVQDPAVGTSSTALLSIDSSQEYMVHFYPDKTSASGWGMTKVQVAPPNGAGNQIARLAAFAQSGITNALAYFPLDTGNSAVWLQSATPGIWSQAPLTHDAANALAYTYQTDYYVDAAGNQYLYGVSGNFSPAAFFIVWFDPLAGKTGKWDVLYEQYLDGFTPALSTGAAFRLMPGANGGINVLWIENGVIYWQPATITDPGSANAEFAWSGSVSSFNPQLGALTIGQIIAFPGSAGDSNLLTIDSLGTLYLIAGYDQTNPTMTPLTGGTNQPAGALSATVGVDAAENLIVLLAETTTQALWILRQNGTNGLVPQFASWVPLGNTVGAVAAPASMAAGAELFLVDPNLDVYHMSQNLTDFVWATRKIGAPTPTGTTPTNIAGTVATLTVVDARQAPIGNALISVSSDQSVTIVVGGVSYQVTPGAPAQIEADVAGQASVVVHATSLSAPPLTFTVTNQDGTTARRTCQGDQVQVKEGETAPPASPASVASRLAGQDPNQPLTASALQNADLIDPGYSDPSGAVTAITSCGQWMLANDPDNINTLAVKRVPAQHWRIEFPVDGSPRFRTLTEDEARVYLERARGATPGSFFSDIFGDAANFFKHAWQQVHSVTATTIGDVLTIVFNDATSYTINTIREAGQALETIFRRVIQALKDAYEAVLDVLDWLKQLFEWADILNTHRVIKAIVNSALTELSNSIGTAEQKVEQQFSSVTDKITSAIDNIESIFPEGQTFNSLANAAGTSPIGGSGNVLAGQPASIAYNQNASRANYVLRHLKTYYTGSAGGGGGSVGNVTNTVQSQWAGNTFNQQTQAVQNFINYNVSSPHAFFDLIIRDLLDAAKDLIIFLLEGVEEIIVAVLDVLQDAITGLQNAWNQTIDVPVISWLYTNVITNGDDLTVLDALSLVLAVPATVLYKILHGNGNAPFTSAQAAMIEQNGLPWPQFSQLGAARRGATAGAAASTSAVPTELLGILAGVSNFFSTFITMGADGQAFTESPDGGLTTLLSWGSLVAGLVSQVGGAPWDVFAKGPQTAADDWTVVLWTCSGVPLISDLIFTFATGGLARFTDEVGPTLDTGMGWVMTGLAAATIVEQNGAKPPYTDWDQSNAIIPQFGRTQKWLILSKDDPEAAAVALPTLLILDFVLGLGSTVTQIGDAIADSEAAAPMHQAG